MLFFATLGYALVMIALMLTMPRSAVVSGAIAAAFGMGWISWPIANVPTFWLVHALGLSAGGLAVVLDVQYWRKRRELRDLYGEIAELEAELEQVRTVLSPEVA